MILRRKEGVWSREWPPAGSEMIKTETKSSGHDGSVCLTRLEVQRFPDAEAPPPQRFPALKLHPPTFSPMLKLRPHTNRPHVPTQRASRLKLLTLSAHTPNAARANRAAHFNNDEKRQDSRRFETGRRTSVFVTSSTSSDRNITAKRRN